MCRLLTSPTNLCISKWVSHHFLLGACLECSYTTSFMVILLTNHISHHSTKYLLFFLWVYLESWQNSQHNYEVCLPKAFLSAHLSKASQAYREVIFLCDFSSWTYKSVIWKVDSPKETVQQYQFWKDFCCNYVIVGH